MPTAIRSLCLSIAVCASAVAPALADGLIYLTGNDLTQYCRSFTALNRNGNKPTSVQQTYEAALCVGSVQAINDTITHSRPDDAARGYCLVPGTTVGAITEVVARYLEDHPEARTDGTPAIVTVALGMRWPCR
jgi:hypothetical protein